MKFIAINYFTLLFSLSVLFISCKSDKSTISGNIENAKNETLFFEQLSPIKITKLDSVKTDKNGDFSFSAKVPVYGFYRVRLDDNNFITLLLDSTSKVEIKANALSMQEGYTIKGSPESEKIAALFDVVRKSFGRRDSIEQVANLLNQSGKLDSVTRSQLTAIYFAETAAHHEYIIKFINENKGSLLPLLASDYLNPNEDVQELIKLGESLNADFPNSDYVKAFNGRLNELKRLAIGSPAPEIIVNDPDGKPIRLSQFKGKVVLIDFWASWCKPCRMENPNVVKAYLKYKDKGFEIFGVSLDQTKDAWVKAIADDHLTWKHGSELAAWNSTFVNTYNFAKEGIPKTFLIDRNGIIIGKDLRGPLLEKKLEEILK